MDSRSSNDEQGFSIRGAASRSVRREEEYEHRRPSPPEPRRERSPPPPPRHDRSPPSPRHERSPRAPSRDRFHDVDALPHPRGGPREYRRRRDDDNDRHYRPEEPHHRPRQPPRDWPPRESNPRHRSSDKQHDPTVYIPPDMEYDDPMEPPAANGEKDVATDGHQWRVLLIRGIKLTVDEGLLAKGLEKLYLDEELPPIPAAVPSAVPPLSRPPPPPGASPLSLKRVLLIRDRVTDRSLGYGFAEYHTTTDAVAAVAKAKQLGNTCTISSKQIEVCHPHLGVFSPVLSRSRDEQKWVFDFNGQPRTYFDTRYFASPHIVNEHPPAAPADESSSKDTSSTKPKKRTKTEAMGTLDKPTEPSKKKAKKESGMVALLNRNQAQARGEDVEGEANDESSSHAKSSANPHSSADVNAATGTGHQQSFAYDGEAPNGQRLTCCFLCSAKFQTRETLERHVQESQKHAENYKSDEAFAKGLANMKKRNVAEDETLKVEMKNATKQQEPEKREPSEYVDRAAKRRAEEAKQKAAGSFQTVSLKDAARKSKAPDNNINNTTPSAPAAPISFGIGRNLLAKAGWQEGQALGTAGSGITAPIEQNMYAAGVGLGHQSSKQGNAVEEAQRQTVGERGGFVEKTKHAVRARFESLNQGREKE